MSAMPIPLLFFVTVSMTIVFPIKASFSILYNQMLQILLIVARTQL